MQIKIPGVDTNSTPPEAKDICVELVDLSFTTDALVDVTIGGACVRVTARALLAAAHAAILAKPAPVHFSWAQHTGLYGPAGTEIPSPFTPPFRFAGG